MNKLECGCVISIERKLILEICEIHGSWKIK